MLRPSCNLSMRLPFLKSELNKTTITTLTFYQIQLSPKLFHNPSSPPSSFSTTPTHINTLINTVTNSKNSKHAAQIHTQIITNNFISLNFLFNNLLNFYAKCGHLQKSVTLFYTTTHESKNAITWTSLITQLSLHNKPNKTLHFFNEMRKTGLYPNQFTFSAVVSACANMNIVFNGEQIHDLICKHGFQFDLFVASAVVNMYAKCGVMMSAEKLFDEMPVRNVVSWNSMIVGFLQNKLYGQAAGLFKLMIEDSSLRPDQVSFSSIFAVCANMGDLDLGRQVHALADKHGLNPLPCVKNSLMDMYCKCKLFKDAVRLLQTVEDRDIFTWNIIANGCVLNEKFKEACNYFRLMRSEGISPDETSYSTVLNAVANIAALDEGTSIHNQIIKHGFTSNTYVSSSLITMYAKCGNLVDSHRIFAESENRNVVSWTAIISAYQQHGLVEKVIELFQIMLHENINPNYITFVSVLSACGHTGRVDEGFKYFNLMTKVHKIKPGPEHYACMVNLLARSGRLTAAMDFTESMPIEAKASVWGSLLAGCETWGNLELGCKVAERLFEIEPDNMGNYVVLSNMYVRYGYLKEADELRRIMGVNGVKKKLGISSIDVKNKSFTLD